MKHHHHLQQSPTGSQALPIYQPDLPLLVLFPELLRGPACQSTLQLVNQNNGLRCSVCQSLPAPKTIFLVQPSVCSCSCFLSRSARKPQRTRGVHPLHKCSVQGFWEISSRMQKNQKKKPQRRDPVLDDPSEHRTKRKGARHGNSGL